MQIFDPSLAVNTLSLLDPLTGMCEHVITQDTHVFFLWGRPAVNCLDRHVHTCPERVALIWERDEPGSEVKVTYRSGNWMVSPCGCTVVGSTVSFTGSYWT